MSKSHVPTPPAPPEDPHASEHRVAAQQPPPAREQDEAKPTVKVRATRIGFLDHRRRPGDVFLVTEAQFTDTWMTRVDPATPTHAESPLDARRAEHQALRSGPPRLKPNAIDLEDDEEPTGKTRVLD